MKIITTDNASATQTEHPGRSTLRTFIQSALLAFPLLLALPEVLAIVDTELGAYLGEDARAWLALVAGIIAAGAAALARIMALPAIERALRGIGLGAAPAEPDFGHWDGESEEADIDDFDDVGQAGDGTIDLDESDDTGETPLTDVDLDALAANEEDLTPAPDDYEPRH